MLKSMLKSMLKTNADAIERALLLAVQAHQGQRDKAGDAYILHVLRVFHRVAAQNADTATQQAALLHDVVEDTPISLNRLIDEGFSASVVEVVHKLTHDKTTPYADYIVQLKSSEAATLVKVADIEDNYGLHRVAYRPGIESQDAIRIQKYILSHQFLSDQLDETAYRAGMEQLGVIQPD